MVNNNTKNGKVIFAIIAAILVILVFGLTYRILAVIRPGFISNSPLDSNALDKFPVQIGEWKGQDVPVEEGVLREIHADASVNRLYSQGKESNLVTLFIAASSASIDTLVGHSPEICNVMSGCILANDHLMELLLDDGTILPCQILHFDYDGFLNLGKKTILCYYVADSEFCGNRSVLKLKVRSRSSTVHYMAQVQIAASTTGTQDIDKTEKIVCDFAVKSAPLIADLFSNIRKQQKKGSDNPLAEEDSR